MPVDLENFDFENADGHSLREYAEAQKKAAAEARKALEDQAKATKALADQVAERDLKEKIGAFTDNPKAFQLAKNLGVKPDEEGLKTFIDEYGDLFTKNTTTPAAGSNDQGSQQQVTQPGQAQGIDPRVRQAQQQAQALESLGAGGVTPTQEEALTKIPWSELDPSVDANRLKTMFKELGLNTG